MIECWRTTDLPGKFPTLVARRWIFCKPSWSLIKADYFFIRDLSQNDFDGTLPQLPARLAAMYVNH
jgi:hypothetical protein